MSYDKFKIGKQPCNNLQPFNGDPEYFRHPNYACNCCDKQVVFCVNCPGVHHEDGWENCENKGNEYV